MSKIKHGLSAFSIEKERLLWTVPPNTKVMAQILCDASRIVSGEFCHYYLDESQELIWTYTGEGDPCEKLNVYPRFSIIIPMLVKLNNETKIHRNVRLPRSVGKQIEALILNTSSSSSAASDSGVKNLIVRLAREDSGSFARYSIVSTGKRVGGAFSEFNQDEWLEGLVEQIFEADWPSEVVKWLEGRGVVVPSSSRHGETSKAKGKLSIFDVEEF